MEADDKQGTFHRPANLPSGLSLSVPAVRYPLTDSSSSHTSIEQVLSNSDSGKEKLRDKKHKKEKNSRRRKSEKPAYGIRPTRSDPLVVVGHVRDSEPPSLLFPPSLPEDDVEFRPNFEHSRSSWSALRPLMPFDIARVLQVQSSSTAAAGNGSAGSESNSVTDDDTAELIQVFSEVKKWVDQHDELEAKRRAAERQLQLLMLYCPSPSWQKESAPSLWDRALALCGEALFLLREDPRYLYRWATSLQSRLRSHDSEDAKLLLCRVLDRLFLAPRGSREEFLALRLCRFSLEREMARRPRPLSRVMSAQSPCARFLALALACSAQNRECAATILAPIFEMSVPWPREEPVILGACSGSAWSSVLSRELEELLESRAADIAAVTRQFLQVLCGSVSKLPPSLRYLASLITPLVGRCLPDLRRSANLFSDEREVLHLVGRLVFFRFLLPCMLEPPSGPRSARAAREGAAVFIERQHVAVALLLLRKCFDLQLYDQQRDAPLLVRLFNPLLLDLAGQVENEQAFLRAVTTEVRGCLDPEMFVEYNPLDHSGTSISWTHLAFEFPAHCSANLSTSSFEVLSFGFGELPALASWPERYGSDARQIDDEDAAAKQSKDPLEQVVSQLQEASIRRELDSICRIENDVQLTLESSARRCLALTHLRFLETKTLCVYVLEAIPLNKASPEFSFEQLLEYGLQYAKEISLKPLGTRIEETLLRHKALEKNHLCPWLDVAQEAWDRTSGREKLRNQRARLQTALAGCKKYAAYLQNQWEQADQRVRDALSTTCRCPAELSGKVKQLVEKGVLSSSTLDSKVIKKLHFQITSQQAGLFRWRIFQPEDKGFDLNRLKFKNLEERDVETFDIQLLVVLDKMANANAKQEFYRFELHFSEAVEFLKSKRLLGCK